MKNLFSLNENWNFTHLVPNEYNRFVSIFADKTLSPSISVTTKTNFQYRFIEIRYEQSKDIFKIIIKFRVQIQLKYLNKIKANKLSNSLKNSNKHIILTFLKLLKLKNNKNNISLNNKKSHY